MNELQSNNAGEVHIYELAKEKATQQIVELLKPGKYAGDIARILGAEDLFFEQKRGQQEAIGFNAKAFVQRQIDKGSFLHLPDSFNKLEYVILPSNKGKTIFGQ
jgi:hypothetical protein